MSIVPDDIPHAPAAFMRRVEKLLKPGHPSFALVVLDDDGRPHTLSVANRTGLVVSAAELMTCALALERDDPCVCANCDAWSARARLALAAMGADLPAPN